MGKLSFQRALEDKRSGRSLFWLLGVVVSMMAETPGVESFFRSTVETQGKTVSVEDKLLTIPNTCRKVKV